LLSLTGGGDGFVVSDHVEKREGGEMSVTDQSRSGGQRMGTKAPQNKNNHRGRRGKSHTNGGKKEWKKTRKKDVAGFKRDVNHHLPIGKWHAGLTLEPEGNVQDGG